MRRFRETYKQTFKDLYEDKSSAWSRIDDESIEVLEAIERTTGEGPDDIIGILEKMMNDEYPLHKFHGLEVGPYEGEYIAHDLMLSNVITLDEYVDILKMLVYNR
jgi:hypothetical protein